MLASKLKSHVCSYLGDFQGVDDTSGAPDVSTPQTSQFIIDRYNCLLLDAALEGCFKAVRDTDAKGNDDLEVWVRKGDEVLRQIVLAVHLDVRC